MVRKVQRERIDVLQSLALTSAMSDMSDTTVGSSPRRRSRFPFLDGNHLLDAIEDLILGPNELHNAEEDISVLSPASDATGNISRDSLSVLNKARIRRRPPPHGTQLPPRLPKCPNPPILKKRTIDSARRDPDSMLVNIEDRENEASSPADLDALLVGLSIPTEVSPAKGQWKMVPKTSKRPKSPVPLSESSSSEFNDAEDFDNQAFAETRNTIETYGFGEPSRDPPTGTDRPKTPPLCTSSTEEFEIVFDQLDGGEVFRDIDGPLWGNQAVWEVHEDAPSCDGSEETNLIQISPISFETGRSTPIRPVTIPTRSNDNAPDHSGETRIDGSVCGSERLADKTGEPNSNHDEQNSPSSEAPSESSSAKDDDPVNFANWPNNLQVTPRDGSPLLGVPVEEIEISFGVHEAVFEGRCSTDRPDSLSTELLTAPTEVGGCPGEASPIYTTSPVRFNRVSQRKPDVNVMSTIDGVEVETTRTFHTNLFSINEGIEGQSNPPSPEKAPRVDRLDASSRDEIENDASPEGDQCETKVSDSPPASEGSVEVNFSVSTPSKSSRSSEVKGRRRSFPMKRPHPFSRMEQYIKIPTNPDERRPSSTLARFSPSVLWTQRKSASTKKKKTIWRSPKVSVNHRERLLQGHQQTEARRIALLQNNHPVVPVIDAESIAKSKQQKSLKCFPINDLTQTEDDQTKASPLQHVADIKILQSVGSKESLDEDDEVILDEPNIKDQQICDSTSRSAEATSRLFSCPGVKNLIVGRCPSVLRKTKLGRSSCEPNQIFSDIPDSSVNEVALAKPEDATSKPEDVTVIPIDRTDSSTGGTTRLQDSPGNPGLTPDQAECENPGSLVPEATRDARTVESDENAPEAVSHKGFNSSIFNAPAIRRVLDVEACPHKLQKLNCQGLKRKNHEVRAQLDSRKESGTDKKKNTRSEGTYLADRAKEKSDPLMARARSMVRNESSRNTREPSAPVIRDMKDMAKGAVACDCIEVELTELRQKESLRRFLNSPAHLKGLMEKLSSRRVSHSGKHEVIGRDTLLENAVEHFARSRRSLPLALPSSSTKTGQNKEASTFGHRNFVSTQGPMSATSRRRNENVLVKKDNPPCPSRILAPKPVPQTLPPGQGSASAKARGQNETPAAGQRSRSVRSLPPIPPRIPSDRVDRKTIPSAEDKNRIPKPSSSPALGKQGNTREASSKHQSPTHRNLPPKPTSTTRKPIVLNGAPKKEATPSARHIRNQPLKDTSEQGYAFSAKALQQRAVPPQKQKLVSKNDVLPRSRSTEIEKHGICKGVSRSSQNKPQRPSDHAVTDASAAAKEMRTNRSSKGIQKDQNAAMDVSGSANSRSLVESTLAVKGVTGSDCNGTASKRGKRFPSPMHIINRRSGKRKEDEGKEEKATTKTPTCKIHDEPLLSVSEKSRRLVLMNSTISSSDDDSYSSGDCKSPEPINALQKLEEIRSALSQAQSQTPKSNKVRQIRHAYRRARQKRYPKFADDLPSPSMMSSASSLDTAEKEITERLAIDVDLLSKIKQKKSRLSEIRGSQSDEDATRELEKSLELMRVLKSRAEKTTDDLEKTLHVLRSKNSVLGAPDSSAILKTLCKPCSEPPVAPTPTKSANFSVYSMAKWMTPKSTGSRP